VAKLIPEKYGAAGTAMLAAMMEQIEAAQ